MENNKRQKDCIKMLSASGFLHDMANYGEREVSTSEEGIHFLKELIEKFGMECKIEKQEGGYKILMKDSLWGQWRSDSNDNERTPQKSFEELMDMGYDKEDAADFCNMQEDYLFIGATVQLEIDHQTDALIDRNLDFYIIEHIDWESQTIRFKNTGGVAKFDEIVTNLNEEDSSL